MLGQCSLTNIWHAIAILDLLSMVDLERVLFPRCLPALWGSGKVGDCQSLVCRVS